MPGGSAKFASPLNVGLRKIVSLVALDESTVRTIGPLAATIAESEGLDAHQNAASCAWRNPNENSQAP
jgi:histidinol dehydrogenase